MIKMPNKSKDIIEEAFRLGWESALTLHDMIDKQSDQYAIDDLRDVAYKLYFNALHEDRVKEMEYDVSLPEDDKRQIIRTPCSPLEIRDPEPSKEIKVTVVDRYPCHDCGQDPTWCCGCEEERIWKEKHKL